VLAFDVGLATIAAATIAGLFSYLVKVHKDNRSDHADVAERINEMRTTQLEIRQDIHEIKFDVAALRANDDNHESRLGLLEHPYGDAA
jgi:hypothetical protein